MAILAGELSRQFEIQTLIGSLRMRFLSDYLAEHANCRGDGTALVLSGKTCERLSASPNLTWRELDTLVRALAELLEIRLGLADGEKVAHSVTNTDEDLLFALACSLGRWVECPIDERAGDVVRETCVKQLDALFVSNECKVQLIEEAFGRRIVGRRIVGRRIDGESFPESEGKSGHLESKGADPTEDALILWTSGTSGGAKGVVLSHRSLLANATAKLVAAPQTMSDVRLTVLSIAHAYARTCDIGTWLVSGCTLAIARGYEGWCDRSADLSPTLCNVVPSLADRIVSTAASAKLRFLGCGGAAMSSSNYQVWKDRGVPVVQGYGATETGPVISSQGPEDSVASKVGRVVQGWEWKIQDDRLFVRGPSLMTRYWNDPDATRRKLCDEGWFDTGDVVTECPVTGQLAVHGRSDDRIVLSSGYKIDPHGLESRYLECPGINLARVELSDDQRGIEIWIESEVGGRVTPERLAELGRELPLWERPRAFHWFRIPEDERSKWLTRKGELRRGISLRRFAVRGRSEL